jgi:peptidyl-prolyl cis-trans isomerase C
MSSRHSHSPFIVSKPRRRAPLHAVCSFGCALAAFLLVSCGQPEKPEVILAQVGEHRITAADFMNEVERRTASGRPVPYKETLLDEMIQRQALLQRVKSSGLHQESEIKREIDNLLIGKFLERELSPRVGAVRVSAEEIQAEYDKHEATYNQAAKVRLAILFLEANPKASEAKRMELRDRLNEARRKVIENPPSGGRGGAAMGFGLLAIEYSDDQAGRYRGGDIGWLDEGSFAYRWPRPVLEAGYAQEPGAISEIIEAEGGFYVVTKTDYRAGSTTSLERVQASLRHNLLTEKRREVEATFRKETASITEISINREALASMELPNAARAIAEHRDFQLPLLPGPSDSSGN